MNDTIKLLTQLIHDLPPEKRALLAGMLNDAAEPLAIIGMGCRFPGGASSPESYWRMLKEGVDAIRPFPADRSNSDVLADADDDMAVKMAARWGGFLEQVDTFDAHFFGIAPREAVYMDPQQRLLLEVAWEALENAGQAVDRLAGSATGVFVGVCTSDYLHFHIRSSDHAHLDPYSTSGTAHSIVANRLSYLLDFQGPSVAVDTACSSSLVALHLACQSLRSGECRLALAGGVNLMLSREPSLAFSRLGMLASDGRCKTFDSQADGYVRGEGCGVVVLKRLSDALADADPILALVRGSAINQDGRSNGLTAPNVLAQQAVIRQALRNAGVSPEQIGYVEAHGTGTSLGDPIETEALASVLGQAGAAYRPCLLGSVKTNIGHLEAAAGIAGLIKTVLALQNEEIPSHLHFRTLNPNISLANSPLVIPTGAQPWPHTGETRFAGVSAFGFGGTNAHIVLEEAPEHVPVRRDHEVSPIGEAYLLPISARSPEALQTLARSYYQLLLADTTLDLSDLCYTASVRRSHHKYRLALVARSRDELISSLETWLHGSTTFTPRFLTREQALQSLTEGGHGAFLDSGPQEALSLMEQEEYQQRGSVLPSQRDGTSAQVALVEALGTLYTHGYAINWSLLYPDGGTCLALPSYPWQRKRYWVEYSTTPNVASHTDANKTGTAAHQHDDPPPSWTDWIYELKWQPMERQTSAHSDRCAQEEVQGDWIIFADSRGIGKALARRLEERGDRCVLVFPGQGFEQYTSEKYQINPASAEDFRRLIGEIHAEQLRRPTVVHLWSLEAPAPEEVFDPSLDAEHPSVCESVLHLLQTVPQVKWVTSPRLWLVTCGAQPVGGPASLAVTQAPVWGMGRTAALEYANMWGGVVDLDPQASPEIAALQVMGAVATGAAEGEDQLAFRGDQRYTLRLLPRQSSAASLPMRIHSDGAYLITGGLGAIGIKVAFWLAEHGAKHLVLLGRTGLPARSSIEQLAPGSEMRKRAEAISALEAQGVEVQVVEADVSDFEQMSHVFEGIVGGEYPLRGIIHSAGVSVSQTIGTIDIPTLRAVLQPKVKGSWVLHRLSQSLELDFFVLFSSASAVWGSPQLAAYTAANLFLDALAHTRGAQGLPALSINWGLWADSGMVSRKIEEVISKAGVLPMQAAPALAALEHLLGTDEVQATIARVDWKVFVPTYETGRKRPLLEYMGAVLEKRSESSTGQESELVSRLKEATYDERQAVLERYIQEEFNKVMGFEPSTSFDREQSLFELGMDSILALQLENRLEKSLGMSFPTTVPFDYPTIATLASCLNDWCFN